MTHSRREMLKEAAAAAAVASLPRRAGAQDSVGQARARIDAVLKQAVDARDVPGVVAMAATDKGLLYQGAFGPRALDASAGMTPDTVFRIASMTKAIASVAAMQLVEQGKLKLEEPVPNIDPWLGSPQVLEASTPPARRSCVRPSGRSRCGIC
jgi:methyl acetate hydrolase